MITTKINSTLFNDQLVALQKALVDSGKTGDAATIVKDESRLLLKFCIKFTPPKKLAQGRNAIKEDLLGGRKMGATGAKKSRGIFFPIQPGYMPFRVPKARKGSSRPVGKTVTLFVTKDGEVYGADMQYYHPRATQDELKKLHYKLRSTRTGRTTLAGNWDRKIGRWRGLEVMIAKRAIIMRYVAGVQKRVGRAKAAWAQSFKDLGGKPAAWYGKHIPTPKAISKPRLEGANPQVTMGSSAPAVRDIEHHIRGAIRERQKAIAKRIRLIVSGYNKEMARGMRPGKKARLDPANAIAA